MTNNLKAPKNNIISLCKLGSSIGIITNLDMSHMHAYCDLCKKMSRVPEHNYMCHVHEIWPVDPEILECTCQPHFMQFNRMEIQVF